MAKTKRQRFIEVATKRTNKVISSIRLLGNCSSKNNYEYTEEEVSKMFAAVDEELRLAKAKYSKKKKKKEFSC